MNSNKSSVVFAAVVLGSCGSRSEPEQAVEESPVESRASIVRRELRLADERLVHEQVVRDMHTTAPMPLLLDRMGGILKPSADSDLTITWREPQLGSRIRLELRSDNAAHGVIAPALLQCDLPDRGFVTVPRSLLTEFFGAEYWGCENCMPSVITRYYRTVIAVDNTDLELMNGAVQLLFLPAI
ncbi:MAG: hypothetical protein JKY56_13290 [Kofleriaceae bacterium]|nr:hypothetical protein [Kofleriaceae bacterium]